MHHVSVAPFSTGYLMVVDSLRVVGCVLAAAVFGLYFGQAITNRKLDMRDRAKSIGLCLVMCLVFFTNVDRLGRPATWRLALTLPGVILIAWGNSPKSKRPFHLIGK